MTAFDINRLKAEIKKVLPRVRELRHQIHRNPEIALNERNTRAAVAAALKRTSLKVWKPLMKTDFIGEFAGASKETIVLRGDIDALPIAEESPLPYRSRVPGMMHACGHDGNTSIVVGAALVLDAMRELLPVTVRVVFQPGEEVQAAGNQLVDLGCCKGAAAAFALHGNPGPAVGTITCRPGPFLAAADFFTADLIGKGGHGAAPHKAINPIVITAKAVAALAALHKRVNAVDNSVVTVCSVAGGKGANVIPDSVRIQGTVRYFDRKRGKLIQAEIRRILHDAAAAAGGKVKIAYENPYGLPVVNAPQSVSFIRDLVQTYIAPDAYVEAPRPLMFSEDFAYFLDGRAGAMFFLGLGPKCPPLHTSRFDFNDNALANGILTMCLIALQYGRGLRAWPAAKGRRS